MKKRRWIFGLVLTIFYVCIVMSQPVCAQETQNSFAITAIAVPAEEEEITYLYLIILVMVLVAAGVLIIRKDGEDKRK